MAPDLPEQRVVAGAGDSGGGGMLRPIDAERFGAATPLFVGLGLSTLCDSPAAGRSRTSPRSGANASGAGNGAGSSGNLHFDSSAAPDRLGRIVTPPLADIFPVADSHHACSGLLWDLPDVSGNPFVAGREKDESSAFVGAQP